jgi:hypothetical protein
MAKSRQLLEEQQTQMQAQMAAQQAAMNAMLQQRFAYYDQRLMVSCS